MPTYDGTMVRSKSEALIYNFFLQLGLAFVYELPLEKNIRTFYPDFTILSEIDYRSVYRIEHQGMMNIFFTFDYYSGGVDVDPILDIVRLKIRPAAEAVQAG